MAVVGCDTQRGSLRPLLCAIQPDVVLLGRSDSAYRRNLVLGHRVASSLVSKPASGLCRWPDLLLDRILLAHDGHRSRLVRSSVLHGDLFRDLGVVLQSGAATST